MRAPEASARPTEILGGPSGGLQSPRGRGNNLKKPCLLKGSLKHRSGGDSVWEFDTEMVFPMDLVDLAHSKLLLRLVPGAPASALGSPVVATCVLWWSVHGASSGNVISRPQSTQVKTRSQRDIRSA